jgi:hypothetical protein
MEWRIVVLAFDSKREVVADESSAAVDTLVESSIVLMRRF